MQPGVGAMKNEQKRVASRAFHAASLLVLACGPAAVAPAHAAPLEVQAIQTQTRHTFSYTCGNGKTFKVTYLNAKNGQSFAVVPVQGRSLLFVSTIAASGVKYQADRFTWWTKGPHADLYDATAGEYATPVLSGCATIMR